MWFYNQSVKLEFSNFSPWLAQIPFCTFFVYVCVVVCFFLENEEQGSVAKASSKASSSEVKEVSQKDENDDEDELGKMIEEERSETGRVSN